MVPGPVDLVLVAVYVIGLWIREERLVDMGKSIGVQCVVVVKQGDELTFCHCQRLVGGRDDATVFLSPTNPDSRVSVPRLVEHCLYV